MFKIPFTPDIINGSFELVGSFFIIKNILTLLRDQDIKGIYWPTTLFFTFWGIWNLLYYPSLNQSFSFFAGILLTLFNIIWLLIVAKIKAR